MTIQSDIWIREQAQRGMIEPFEAGQVRSINDQKIVSYGTSSYGYDVRCAGEFKIFTNVHSTVIDPKAFDSRNFVDVESDVCIIPPNSFALARTVEYFKIPRDVLVVCLGKSTYARCFRGDTRVALVDGSEPTLEDMAKRHAQGESFWGYSVGENGRVMVTLLDAPRFVGRDSLVEVTLDNGKTIAATPDHLFMLRDGRWLAAGDLREGMSLMPLYRDLHRGYEMTYQPINGHLYPTHRMADDWNVRHGLYADVEGTHRHHIDHNRLNNNPWNLERMEASAHIRHHNEENYGEDFDPEEHSAAIREALYQRLRMDTAWKQISQAHPRHATAQFRGMAAPHNHKVTAVRALPGDHDVYCLTVPEAGNFALASGVFVKNCGIIVNVTPLEPEWEGHVTLEFSNTTTLPAKIYANEGVAQMLFFKGDQPCATSYKDRGGKYQGQRGVTLPRT
jgi:dCTP deaminase